MSYSTVSPALDGGEAQSGLWEAILMPWLAWVETAAVWMGRVYSSFSLYLLSSSSTSMSLV